MTNSIRYEGRSKISPQIGLLEVFSLDRKTKNRCWYVVSTKIQLNFSIFWKFAFPIFKKVEKYIFMSLFNYI